MRTHVFALNMVADACRANRLLFLMCRVRRLVPDGAGTCGVTGCAVGALMCRQSMISVGIKLPFGGFVTRCSDC